MPTVHLIIKGKVQGVFYRATAKKKADENGITGWIQNTPGDDVEVVVSGSQQALQKFIDWCRKGPAMAEVTDVIMVEKEEEWHEEFIIKR